MEDNRQLQLEGFYYCVVYSDLGLACKYQCSECKIKEKVDTAIFRNFLKKFKDESKKLAERP